ncbi:hypothetical protein PTTG_28891 [Puccinia triticina 1-1 BBBD Race 1]|uniref:Uncharacterized protein n=1 Tax=Puccinia triticina (isolate 1-1 / race 1 (BBBD)) TaxID=630390 RepID=A0A180G974_PUCT1|nr:hypothetical protein PTTG_28891 [Puccinia triticina 1-1 BBBD Race 1]
MPSHSVVASATVSSSTRARLWFFFGTVAGVDDEAKLMLHGLEQHFVKIDKVENNRKLNDLLNTLEFKQVCIIVK